MNKKVSIITPAYNSENFISKAMDSVINQTYKDWEMLIVDDFSEDSTVKIVKEYLNKDNRIKLFQQKENKGAGHARNLAIEKSKGRYIAFLDSDDFWETEKLEKQLSFLKKRNCSIVYSQYFIFDSISEKSTFKVVPPNTTDFKRMQRNDYIGFLTLLLDCEKVGKPLMPTIRKRQDWAFKLLILKKGFIAHCVPEPLAYYRVGNQSLSSNKFKLLKYNFTVFRTVLGYTKLKSTIKLGIFLLYYFIFKFISKEKVK